jgi:hypothetical protein
LPGQSPDPKRLYTNGLVGCTATVLIGTLPAGNKVGYLQHFHPEQNKVGQAKVERVLSVLENAGALLQAGLVYTPGTRHGILSPEYVPQYAWANGLIEAMQAAPRGHDAPISLRTYRSPGRAHALTAFLSLEKHASGIAIDRKKIIARF